MQFGTKVVHAGVSPDPSTGAIMTPIFQTATYAQEAPGKHKGYAYARGKNPTRTALQDSIAALENGKFSLCFSSGMAATDTIIKLLSSGDEVIASADLYGGTYRMFTGVFKKLGIHFHFVDVTDLANIKSCITERTKLFWLETPSNPLMHITDIEACVTLAREHNILVALDNTFASPYLQTPLDLGVDIVMHSVTKYLGGHSDVVMGALVTNNKSLLDQLAFIQNSCGPAPSPHDCFLVLRGIKTLHLRMERHCYNGERIARFLADHPKVKKVYWPGLADHPGHEIAQRQMKGFGGMLSLVLANDTIEKANIFMRSVSVFTLAESLGGVESLISHPASMSHASIPKEERIKNGLTDSLIRLSVGVEDVEDLIEDLQVALDKV